MPHVKIGYPHKTKSGEKRSQGDIVYVSPQEARDLVDGGKGKIVEPSPQEIVDLHKATKGEPKSAPKQEKAPPVPMPQVDRNGQKKTPARNSADG